MKNRQITLASRPDGEPRLENFRLKEAAVPTIAEGQVLLKTLWLSLDPYMRGRMSAAKSYAKPVDIDGVMEGGTVSQVVASHHPKFAVGDIVGSRAGWQEFFASDGTGLQRLDPARAPVQTALGVLGMPGMTAYTGLLNIGQPKAGETVVVAAAAGPVGATVGQIAKIKGCTVVGIAGGPEKVAYCRDVLGFDAAVDHRAPDFAASLAAACPKGIDVYFENVGGAVWHAVLPLLNDFARIPVCGLIADYNMTGPPQGSDHLPGMMRQVLVRRLHIQGFIVTDYAAQARDFYRDVSGWITEGRIKYKEDVVTGLENAPEAFLGLLKGSNFGKLLVKVA
jgi:NADPH-dependent curcumin reductase